MPSNGPFSASVIPFQMPEHMRAFAEGGVSQARANYSRLRNAAENGNGAIEAMLANASKGASDYVAKVLEIVAINTNAGFDFVQQLVGATSLTEGMELWANHTRAQFETYAAQTKELVEFTQKMTGQTLSPISAVTTKTTQAT